MPLRSRTSRGRSARGSSGRGRGGAFLPSNTRPRAAREARPRGFPGGASPAPPPAPPPALSGQLGRRPRCRGLAHASPCGPGPTRARRAGSGPCRRAPRRAGGGRPSARPRPPGSPPLPLPPPAPAPPSPGPRLLAGLAGQRLTYVLWSRMGRRDRRDEGRAGNRGGGGRGRPSFWAPGGRARWGGQRPPPPPAAGSQGRGKGNGLLPGARGSGSWARSCARIPRRCLPFALPRPGPPCSREGPAWRCGRVTAPSNRWSGLLLRRDGGDLGSPIQTQLFPSDTSVQPQVPNLCNVAFTPGIL